MNRTYHLQLVAVYLPCLAAMATLAMTPRPGEPFLYALYPPWMSDAQIERSVASAGGREVVGALASFAVKVAAGEGDAPARLLRHGALLVMGAAPAPFCSRRSAP